MADSKITALTAISTVDPTADPLVIVDVSDTSMAASGTTKKSTINQLLGAGGTATLASATITGDLTVDTSTLKVDSANNRVGMGIAVPAYRLHVQGTASLQLVLQSNDTNANAKEGTVNVRHYTNAEEPVSAVGGFTTSTANEVYLGGGFSAGNAATLLGFYTAANNTTTIGTERYRIASDGVATWSNVGGVAGTAMTLNATGLGIGVTPSAWVSSSKAIDIAAWAGVGYIASSAATVITNNTYKDAASNWVFKNGSNAAGYFEIAQNLYRWWQAPAAGGAGTTAAMVQAMTLDADGDLGVGITNPSHRLHALVSSGADRDIFAAQVLGASNGLQVKWNHATTTLRVILANLPTSSAGLPIGTLWIDTTAGNTLKVA